VTLTSEFVVPVAAQYETAGTHLREIALQFYWNTADGRVDGHRAAVYPVVDAGPGRGVASAARHTFASLLLQDDVSLAHVPRMLGHADPRLTAILYGKWLPVDSCWSRTPGRGPPR
jgi:integrase